MSRAALLAVLVAFVAVAPAAVAADRPDGGCDQPTMDGSPDHQPSGNRVVESCLGIQGRWTDVQLGAVPTWVVAHPTRPGQRWVVVAADGTVSELRRGRSTVIGQLPEGEAPLVRRAGGGALEVSSREETAADDALPGSRSVTDGFVGATLVAPTDRYPHGVLGDDLEASAMRIWTDDGATSLVEPEDDQVIEGISPIVAALSDDGQQAFLVTVSDEQVGARLRAFDEHGGLIAESDAIGQGFRWLHQIGVGPTGPAGEIEVIAVRTPHIGGIVEAYRLQDHRLERVAAAEGYSSHQLGSPNLDMALLADTDGDAQLEVVVPTQSMTELAILERSPEGFAEITRLPLDGRLASNVAAAVDRQGRLSLAVATDEGRLRVFR